MKYVVCYSGGHSSALVAIEAVRKHGKKNVILVNHNISGKVEHEDIKRFKKEVAEYLGIKITPANIKIKISDLPFEEQNQIFEDEATPLSVCRKIGAFQVNAGQALCTSKLKTEPFYRYLNENFPVELDELDHYIPRNDVTILYGFDHFEKDRIQRRSSIMAIKGYLTDFPLARWERTISNTEEIGIKRPSTYRIFKHANCIGCLKAGRQHWYVVYCLRPDIFKEAMKAEEEIGFSIIKDVFLEELIPKFEEMKASGICPNDKQNDKTFWAKVNKAMPEQLSFLPCDCAVL